MQIRTLVIKMYLSVIACLLILCTCITTTYAWFGLNEYSSLGDFDLQVTQTSGDGLEMSIDGVNFKSFLSATDMGQLVTDCHKSADSCTAYFSGNNLVFKNVSDEDVDDYIYFEIYITATYDIDEADHDVEVYFSDNILNGNNVQKSLVNPLIHPIFGPLSFPSINSRNTGRVAMVLHNSTPIGRRISEDGLIDTRDYARDEFGDIILDGSGNPTYTDNANPALSFLDDTETSINPRTNIYYGGYVPTNEDLEQLRVTLDNPDMTFQEAMDYYQAKGKNMGSYYDFGGLKSEYNMTIEEWNSFHYGSSRIAIPETIKNRPEEMLNYNKVITKADGLRPTTMMKVGFYLWIEGWDPDCFGQDTQNIELKLAFTTNDPTL